MTNSANEKREINLIERSEDYINSLRNRKLKVYSFGESVEAIAEHPVICPGIVLRNYAIEP